jgi:ABC-2 type transport system ATP-binding protein
MAPSESSPMIEAIGLSKFYRDFAAIRDVSFSIPAGQVVAFLGPNGAGKSTTMKILTGYLAPSAGSAKIAGLDVAAERIAAAERLGYLPENGPLYPDMTPLALLRFFGHARGLDSARLNSRIDDVIHRCALESVLEKSIRKLSKGYRQRVGMAQVLLHEPDVLIMDEPTSGLDPNQIREVRRTIREMAANRTILLSTHILQEVEAVADRVILIDRGRVKFDGTIREMQGPHATLDDAFFSLTNPGAAGAATLADPPQEPAEGGTCAADM